MHMYVVSPYTKENITFNSTNLFFIQQERSRVNDFFISIFFINLTLSCFFYKDYYRNKYNPPLVKFELKYGIAVNMVEDFF